MFLYLTNMNATKAVDGCTGLRSFLFQYSALTTYLPYSKCVQKEFNKD